MCVCRGVCVFVCIEVGVHVDMCIKGACVCV